MSSRVEISLKEGGDCESLTSEDRAFIEGFKSPKRRGEVASWRALLRRLLRVEYPQYSELPILYNSVGAPYLEGAELHFGVSHSATHVAIIISTTPCAIDIESTTRDFERVASRYATEQERTKAPLPLIWSAKETLYKLSGREGLDLLSDLTIEECTENQIQGSVCGQRYLLHYFQQEELVVVHTI